MKIAIQGELGSNSHMAALEMVAGGEIVACALSRSVLEGVVEGRVDIAVLPIENSLHGSVAEHYDLLFEQAVQVVGESLLRIRHNLIVAPGVKMEDVRRVISHPVALSQCRKFLEEKKLEVMPFYDTAGSVKHLMEEGLRDTAGVAPRLAAEVYGGSVLVENIEDHEENYTRFHLICREDRVGEFAVEADKLTLAFGLEHRPGSLVEALQVIAGEGVNLTKIESRPVVGRPWEYLFYVDLRFSGSAQADAVVEALKNQCHTVKELGRYRAAGERFSR